MTSHPHPSLPQDLAERFEWITQLTDNWDSYGAPPIDRYSIQEAADMVKVGVELGLPTPFVAPGGDAGVGIEWKNERGELVIDLIPDADVTYFLSNRRPDGSEEESEGTIESAVQVRQLLVQLAGGEV